jgi:hypothetical protein
LASSSWSRVLAAPRLSIPRYEGVGPLVDLHQAVVTEAAVYKDGRLRVSFADGRTLHVPAGAHYEAFEITGGTDGAEPYRLISLPGGGLAEWGVGER